MNSFTTPISTGSEYTSYVLDSYNHSGVITSSISDKVHTYTVYWSIDGVNWDFSEVHTVAAGIAFYDQSTNRARYVKYKITNTSGADMTYLRCHMKVADVVENEMTVTVQNDINTYSNVMLNNSNLNDTQTTSSYDCNGLMNITILGNVTNVGTKLIFQESVDNITFYDSNDTFVLIASQSFHFETDLNTRYIKFKADGNFTGLTIIVSGKK